MTTTTFTKQEVVNLLKHLAGGKTAAQVAVIMGRKVDEIIELAKNHGYPDVEKLKWAADILEKKLTDDSQLEERPLAAGASIATPSRARENVSSQLVRGTLPPVAAPDSIRILINTARAHPSKRIRTACGRLLAQIERLDEMIAEDDAKNAAKRAEQAAKAEARAEVEHLKAQLAAAQAKLRGPAKTEPTPANTSGQPTAAEIRAWATRAGVDCPKVGRIPADVRDAYDDAHVQAAS